MIFNKKRRYVCENLVDNLWTALDGILQKVRNETSIVFQGFLINHIEYILNYRLWPNLPSHQVGQNLLYLLKLYLAEIPSTVCSTQVHNSKPLVAHFSFKKWSVAHNSSWTDGSHHDLSIYAKKTVLPNLTLSALRYESAELFWYRYS